MHILLTTYGLLLIFTLYCASQWRSATDMAFMDIVSTDLFALSREKALDELNDRSHSLFDKASDSSRPKQRTQKSIANTVDSTKQADTDALITIEDEDHETEALNLREKPEENTPQKKNLPGKKNSTSFLNIGDLFTNDDLNIHEGKGKATFSLLKNLMTVMYEDQKFFKEAKEADSEFEEHFLLNLYEKAKETNEKRSLGRVKDLGTINLDDELQNYVRYKMFRGNKSRLNPNSQNESGYYSLLDFTRMSKNKPLLSLWLAPKPILMALFQKSEIVEEVIAVRREIYNDMRRTNSQLSTQERDLRLRFAMYIPEDTLPFVDFQITTTLAKDDAKPKARKKRTN